MTCRTFGKEDTILISNLKIDGNWKDGKSLTPIRHLLSQSTKTILPVKEGQVYPSLIKWRNPTTKMWSTRCLSKDGMQPFYSWSSLPQFPSNNSGLFLTEDGFGARQPQPKMVVVDETLHLNLAEVSFHCGTQVRRTCQGAKCLWPRDAYWGCRRVPIMQTRWQSSHQDMPSRRGTCDTIP